MSRASTKKKKGKGPRSPGTLVLGLLLMAIFFGELLAYTMCRVQCTKLGYDITKADGKQDRLLAVQKELQVELARLKSPERLARIAETSMGLKSPTSRQIVVLE